jgi:ATP-dependent Clp protease ATP-binding subunit ClpC
MNLDEQAWANLSKPPIVQIDRERISGSVKSKIRGQDDTIDLIVEQVRNGLASNPDVREGPIGVFMLMGPPGTGKTSLARILATEIFESNEGFYMVDMNSCRDENAAWTYFGSPQGFAGGRGLLTTAIRRRQSNGMLILLDEFEKASPTVHRMFLNAWATGFIVDNRDGEQISTRNTIWILTTNAMAEDAESEKRETKDDRDTFNERMRVKLLEEPLTQKMIFPPEVLSRISEFFCLERLSFTSQAQRVMGYELVRGIMARLAHEFYLQLKEQDISSEAAAYALRKLTNEFQVGGIRELSRWLRRQLATQFVDLALSGKTHVCVSVSGELNEPIRLVARSFDAQP